MRFVCDWLLAPRTFKLLLGLSASISLLCCASLFDTGFVAGTSAFWESPRGIVGGGFVDVMEVLSGDLYFVHDGWHLPLFHVAALGAPEGSNVVLACVPIVAIIERLLFETTGHLSNLYGIWTIMAYAGSGIALSLLVALLGARSLAACCMASVCGAMMPELLARWGHIALLPQGQISLALAFYLLTLRHGRIWLGLIGLAVDMLLALASHPYLFVMVSGIAAATLLQATLDRRLTWTTGAALATGAVFGCSGIIAVFGGFADGGPLAGAGFGTYTLNPLSLFKPQMSGLLPMYAKFKLDQTGGQYEGFSYLGGGLLVLLPFTLPRVASALWRQRAHHGVLLTVIGGFVVFAMSNHITLPPHFSFVIPMPDRVLRIASILRSSGRFVWPAMFALTAVVITTTISRFGRAAAPILLVATGLQWLDTAPLRYAVAASAAQAHHVPLSPTELRAEIAHYDFVRMLPSYACDDVNQLMPDGLPNGVLAVQVQLEAARAGVPTNSAYLARQEPDCAAERAASGMLPPDPRELRIYLRSEYSPADLPRDYDRSWCRLVPDAMICGSLAK